MQLRGKLACIIKTLREAEKSWGGYIVYTLLAELCGLLSFGFFLKYAHDFTSSHFSWILLAVALLSLFAYLLSIRAYGRKQFYLAEQTLKREQILMSSVLNTHPMQLKALIERHLQAQKINDARSGIVPSANPADLIASRITGNTLSRVEFEFDYRAAKWLLLLAGLAFVVPFLPFLFSSPFHTEPIKESGLAQFGNHPLCSVFLMLFPYLLSVCALLFVYDRITKRRRGGDEIALKLDQENATAREFLHGWSTIRHANAFSFAERKIANSFSATRGIRLALSDAYNISSGSDFLITCVVSAVTLLLAWKNVVDFPVVATFVTLNNWFATKLAAFFSLLIRKKKQNYANGLLVDLGSLQPSDKAQSIPPPDGSPDFEFRDVSLTLPNGKPILQNVSMAIRHGEHIGIVGLTGAGKTSLLKAMLGDLPTTTGEVLIKGIAASEVSRSQLAEWIGVLPQQHSVFNATIRENILLKTGEDMAESRVTDDAIRKILQETTLDKDLSKRKISSQNLLDIQLSAHGVNLSVGEMAKLAMARILIRKHDILILDEYDSALDEASKNSLASLIRRMSEHTTLIQVSHRPTDLKNMHRILVLDDGKIDVGTYDELIGKPGLFAQLHALETGIETDAARATKLTYATIDEGIRKTLQFSHIFAHLNWTLTAKLARQTESVTKSTGEYVVRRGDTGDSMFSIISGEVEINGRTFGPGDSFGEIALFADDARRTADVRCKTDCVLAQLSRASVLELCEKEPSAAIEILKATATIAARESARATVRADAR